MRSSGNQNCDKLYVKHFTSLAQLQKIHLNFEEENAKEKIDNLILLTKIPFRSEKGFELKNLHVNDSLESF